MAPDRGRAALLAAVPVAGDPLDEGPLVALVGVTASGKSDVAVELADRVGGEVLSLDSMLVYRGLDVGTAKPTAEARARVPHHLIDLVDPPERYDVQRYLADARAAVADVRARGAQPLFCGGTAFYLKALTHGLFEGPAIDAELRARLERRAETEGSPALHAELAAIDSVAAARIHPNDARRVVRGLEVWEQTGRTLTSWQQQWSGAALGPDEEGEVASEPAAERQELPGRPRTLIGLEVDPRFHERGIAERTRAMLAGGWIEETRAVRDGLGFGPTSIQALGYREVIDHLDGLLDRNELTELVALRTRQFARRQRTWLRRFPEIRWVQAPAKNRTPSAVAEEVRVLLQP